MSSLLGKIPAALHPRVRSLEAPRNNAPIPSSQREERLLCSQDRNERINNIISGFLAEINNVAARMSSEFALSHRHCLDLLFQGGVKMQQERNNASSWTAYLSEKAATGISDFTILNFLFSFLLARKDGDDPINLMKFQQDIRAEYHALTAEEKADYVTVHEDRKADLVKARRPSAKARVTDMVKTLDNVEAMVSVLFIEVALIFDPFDSLKLSKSALALRASFTLSDPMPSFTVVPASGTHIPSSRRT
jgi:hypothetical protein